MIPLSLAVIGIFFMAAAGTVAWYAQTYAPAHPSFRTEFGFKPQNHKKDWSSALYEAEQKKVTEVLTRLARSFAAWDAYQRRTSAPPANGDFAAWHETQKARLATARTEVNYAKQRFWWAHNLAKKHGFGICSRYTDYLPEEERVEREAAQQ